MMREGERERKEFRETEGIGCLGVGVMFGGGLLGFCKEGSL